MRRSNLSPVERNKGNRVVGRCLTLALILAASLLSAAQPAVAAGEGPQWTVSSVSRPTNFAPGDESGEDFYLVTVTNTGATASDGSPITITDELPEGLSLDPRGASGVDEITSTRVLPGPQVSCVLAACTYTGVVVPEDVLILKIPVDVAASPPASCQVPEGAVSCVKNLVRVSGGGAPDAAVETPTAVSSSLARFGISPGGASTALSSTQAGAHPDVTTSIAFNTVNTKGSLAGDFKDTIDELPRGFASDFIDTPSCPAIDFTRVTCPIGTQVGIVTLNILTPGKTSSFPTTEPVYNLTPDPGDVAKIGFTVPGISSFAGSFTLRPGDYGANVTFPNGYEGVAEVDSVSLTVWGVPADPVHDPWRLVPGQGYRTLQGSPSDAPRVPFVTNPTLCGSAPLAAVFTVNSWEQPENYVSARMPFGPVVGCDRLGMEPVMTVESTTNRANSPTGLDLGLDIPQTYENAYGLATANLDRAVVTLPRGMTVNPSAGAGLQGCSEAQYAEEADPQLGETGGCPNESKLGTVHIQTPAVKEAATGSVYLAQPYANPLRTSAHPTGSLLALYIVARIPQRGIVVRAAGEVQADPITGQLVTSFAELPPLPFSTFTFKFDSGLTAPLVTPPGCGSYTAQAELTPWSTPSQILMPIIPSFPITAAFDGGACPAGAPPLKPQIVSGTEDNAGGAYSPFYLRIVRGDGEQELTKFSTTLPPGLSGNLTGIPFCPEADIQLAKQKTGGQEQAEPSCPPASEIGHTLVEAGVGSSLAQTPGKVYLAGPYNGAPLSIVSITSAKVGPFDLGTVVIRFALDINPLTAQVEVSGAQSDPIPHIIDGIVVHVRDIRVYMDRHDFTLNPTDCSQKSITNAITGAGANFADLADQDTVEISTPFEVADCASLAFKPTFSVATSAKATRANGTSLHVALGYPNAPQGTQANIRSVKVDLPKQLPSRLTTLQKACTSEVFDNNPSACPGASRVGIAKALTPILPVPLEGPAYFVSYGDLKFPELIVVLQGYGFTIDLHGETFISKKGITSSTFRTVPDQPVTSFELTLPAGPNSALAANGNLCTVKGGLKMPTALTAQNGLTIDQVRPIAVNGCPKAKKTPKFVRHHGRRTHRKRR